MAKKKIRRFKVHVRVQRDVEYIIKAPHARKAITLAKDRAIEKTRLRRKDFDNNVTQVWEDPNP